MDTIALLGSLFGLGLGSGVRLYAMILAIGLGIRFHWLQLSPSLDSLNVLAHKWVLIVAGIAFAMEFLADKIPYVDSIWDTVHTIIRPVGAAMLGVTAVGNYDPVVKTIVAILCGSIALTGHSTKAGTRLMANTSPEPFTNVALSVTEDLLAVVWAWLTIQHPVIMFAIVCAFLAFFVWIAPKVFRAIRNRIRAVMNFFRPRTPQRA